MHQPVFYIPGQLNIQDTVDPKTNISHIGKKSLKEYQIKEPTMVCIEFQQAMKEIDAVQYETLTKPKAKIVTEEKFFDMLGSMPPCKHGSSNGIEYFHLAEAYTYDIYSWYTKDQNGRCTTFMDKSNINKETIVQRHKEAWLEISIVSMIRRK